MTNNDPTEKDTTEQRKRFALKRVTHGGYFFLRTGIIPGCSVCWFGRAGQCKKYDQEKTECEVLLNYQDERIKKIMSFPWINDEDAPLVVELCKNEVFLQVLDRWLNLTSPFMLKEGKLTPQGVLKMRWVASNAVLRLSNELGLSPKARRELKLDDKNTFDFAREMQSIEHGGEDGRENEG